MVKLTPKQIEACFEFNHQNDVVEALYRLAFPDYDKIVKINGHPKVGEEVSKLIWDRCIEFDKIHHPDCVAGGAWLNWGFTTDKTLKPWEISTKGVKYETI